MFRTIVTSVGFADFLALTLPWNKHHWRHLCVLTSPDDTATQEVASQNGALIYATNSFYKDGARFNKFLALEECLDFFGRYGLLCLVDADVFWPRSVPFSNYRRGHIYSFKRRRLLLDVTRPIPPEREWPTLPLDPQVGECLGFTQIFHANDPHLGKAPWHRIDIHHAALGDSYFQAKWSLRDRIWIDQDVLHLGNYANNWLGRVVPHRDGSLPRDAEQLVRDVDALKDNIWPQPHPHPSRR